MQLTHMLTDEQKAFQDMIRKFVEKEIMPIREKMEEDYNLVEGVHNKLVELGIQKAGYPPEYGGGGQHSFVTGAILCEELAGVLVDDDLTALQRRELIVKLAGRISSAMPHAEIAAARDQVSSQEDEVKNKGLGGKISAAKSGGGSRAATPRGRKKR